MKVLVDTSVWIDHLHKTDILLVELLRNSEIVTHPFIIGELILGTMKNKEKFLLELSHLSKTIVATQKEVIFTIQKYNLSGKGIGWVDAHLLSSALISKSKIYTKDKNLKKIAEKISFKISSLNRFAK
ncbi:MAG: PIN domain-containing protein [Leptospiraceae bacterium]|nr:PIN domain-containing protein [Leptospiraceae bacterium]MCK6382525.1 PIN domain-containing protein [Leptospiraceae bacterium]NUM41892.1 PIN domain-containing protein [Leptospiraceae bacterium]